jgi:hypothetical protein
VLSLRVKSYPCKSEHRSLPYPAQVGHVDSVSQVAHGIAKVEGEAALEMSVSLIASA